MTTPSNAADPEANEPEDLSQTTGSPLSSSQARGDDKRDDERPDDPAAGSRERVGQGAEPTTETSPGELPDESQGPP